MEADQNIYHLDMRNHWFDISGGPSSIPSWWKNTSYIGKHHHGQLNELYSDYNNAEEKISYHDQRMDKQTPYPAISICSVYTKSPVLKNPSTVKHNLKYFWEFQNMPNELTVCLTVHSNLIWRAGPSARTNLKQWGHLPSAVFASYLPLMLRRFLTDLIMCHCLYFEIVHQ